MIRSSGEESSSAYSQTFNRCDIDPFHFPNEILEFADVSGPFLVSRTGDAG